MLGGGGLRCVWYILGLGACKSGGCTGGRVSVGDRIVTTGGVDALEKKCGSFFHLGVIFQCIDGNGGARAPPVSAAILGRGGFHFIGNPYPLSLGPGCPPE